MREFCYGLQFSVVINGFRPLHSLPYLFDGPIFFFTIFCNQLLQPYSSKRTRTKIVASYPTLFLPHLSLTRSKSRDMIDMLRISSTEYGLEFRVSDQVRDWRHRDCMTSALSLKQSAESSYSVRPTVELSQAGGYQNVTQNYCDFDNVNGLGEGLNHIKLYRSGEAKTRSRRKG